MFLEVSFAARGYLTKEGSNIRAQYCFGVFLNGAGETQVEAIVQFFDMFRECSRLDGD